MIKKLWILSIAFILLTFGLFCPPGGIRYPGLCIALVGSLFLLAFGFFNRKDLIFGWTSIATSTGIFCNSLVIILNNGSMPISIDAMLKISDYSPYNPGEGYKYYDSNTKLAFLGDWIVIPQIDAIVSPGDILVTIPVVFLAYMLIYIITNIVLPKNSDRA